MAVRPNFLGVRCIGPSQAVMTAFAEFLDQLRSETRTPDREVQLPPIIGATQRLSESRVPRPTVDREHPPQ